MGKDRAMTSPSTAVTEAGNRTTAQALARAATLWPDNTALLIDGTRITWRQQLAECLTYLA